VQDNYAMMRREMDELLQRMPRCEEKIFEHADLLVRHRPPHACAP
jgi:uncharacterized coiled-coil protein SlyX